MKEYIKHSDLMRALKKCEEKKGRKVFYNVSDLHKAILALEKYNGPKYTIDNKCEILDNIRKYRKDVTEKKYKSYLYQFLEEKMKIDNIESYKINHFQTFEELKRKNICQDPLTTNEIINIIPTSKMLGELLKISKPTLSRWNKEMAISYYIDIIVYSVNGYYSTRKYRTNRRVYNLVELENYIISLD